MGLIGGLVKIWWKLFTIEMQQFLPVLFRFHIKLPHSHQSCGLNYQARGGGGLHGDDLMGICWIPF